MDDKEKIIKDELFERELLPFVDALHNFAYNLCYNDDGANDLVQETYLKAYRFINSYQEGTNAKAWLFKILKNVYINQYRQRSRRPTSVDIDEINVFTESDDDHTQQAYLDLRKEMFDEMLGDEVTIALNSLPLEFRSVILLSDIEGFSYEEIAKIIEKPIGTVRSRLFRARNMLKEKLKNYADELGYDDVRGSKNKTS
jgi:RNA polymerase sigma-70 factor (ECF subfamily)